MEPDNPSPSAPAQGLTVITTHMNADFDALASMLAAQKLYPEALAVFPGSQERNLRDFFITSMVYLFNLADMKSLEPAEVRRLVVVDTRQPARLTHVAPILATPDLEIHIYDHHPAMPGDLHGNVEVIAAVGATVTLLAELIRRQEIPLNAEEATVMGLGIYEDTGSFTFGSTTERDFGAAAWLLSRGANLNSIASLISREINPDQVSLLNEMIQAATTYTINGVDVVVTSVSRDRYVPDFAFVVHKMIKMENLKAIFALARMGNKIYLVGRSRLSEVDAGAVLGPFGGGGHRYAASATVRDETLVQTEHRLLEQLHATVQSQRRAGDLMSSPAIMTPTTTTCREAAGLVTRYGINALLVTAEDGAAPPLAGYITRQVIEKALYHDLGQVPVAEYMSTELVSVGPEAELSEIQEKIIGHKQRILPVILGGKVLGVITRTDLLNLLVRHNQEISIDEDNPFKPQVQVRTRNILKFMRERLSKRILTLLREIGRVAGELEMRAFVAGGFVRDLFLYRRNEDVDIVIEGDGIRFAKTFAQRKQARIHAHQKFGTAVIIFSDGFKIDVASARMEYYQFPAALPTVEMSSIKLDLFRRDFTINTLAIQLAPQRFGTLIDFFSAQKDLKEKVVRVLHNLSFVEDPTRVFRAIRFEQRFGFSIGKLTSSLIENAVRMDFFKRLSGRRVFTELRLILSEDDPTPALVRMADYQLLEVIHPALTLDDDLVRLFTNVRDVLAWHDLLFLDETVLRWAVYYLALVRHGDRRTSLEICRRLEMAPRYERIFCKERFEADRCLTWLERRTRVQNSALYRELEGFRTELILYMMAATTLERVKKAISLYYTQLRHVRPQIRGQDLMKLGIAPGPVYRDILDAVLAARLDGRISRREEELAFARRYARRA